MRGVRGTHYPPTELITRTVFFIAVLLKLPSMVELVTGKDGTMSARGTEVLKEALSLPPADRAEIAERLLSSLDSAARQRVDKLWADEVEDRLDALDQGEIRTVPANQVSDQIGLKTR